MRYRVELTVWAETDEEFRRRGTEAVNCTNLEGKSWERSNGFGQPEISCQIVPMPPPNRFTIAKEKARQS